MKGTEKRSGKWFARIYLRGSQRRIGPGLESEERAALLYDVALSYFKTGNNRLPSENNFGPLKWEDNEEFLQICRDLERTLGPAPEVAKPVRANKLTGIEQRLTGIEQRLTGIEQRLTGLEQPLTDVEPITVPDQRAVALPAVPVMPF